MKHLDLFSGIGGFALATEMVWDDVEHVFCDNEPFAQEVLKKHWPNSKIYGDIKKLSKKQFIADTRIQKSDWVPQQPWTESIKAREFYLLTGGFPCQPFSQAGARKGTEDDRHLWPEMLRVIQEFHPRWIIAENVSGFLTWNGGMVFRQVFTDLEDAGYEVQPFIIPAVAVNAPHRRDRVWFVAHRRQQHGSEGRNERMETEEKEWGTRPTDFERQNKDVANAKSERPQRLGKKSKGNEPTLSKYNSDWGKSWIEVATKLCRMDDGLPRRLDRASRLKALGNAIVPQVAKEIMEVIKRLDLYN